MEISQVNDPTKKLTRMLIEFENSSGAALAHGDVIVKDLADIATAVAADTTGQTCPELAKTTTTQDDPLVLGVVFDPGGKGIADGGVGVYMCRGYHDNVKVDGTTDIAAGDQLTTFTTAKIAAKVSTIAVGAQIGHALEAYATDDSAGTIAAFIDIK